MKTLVVLSALVCIAIAAPALPENGFQTLDTPEDIHPLNFDSEITDPGISARSHFGLKRPIIVKKKTGYHLYRDSTEERANAEPHERCSQHLRVKVCDENVAKSADLRRSTKIKDIDAHKDNVDESIKIAKEAVESLQLDLKNIEHSPSAKNAQWKHKVSPKNVHEDIAGVKPSSRHVQTNFGNLESMSLRATTLGDTEALHAMNKGKLEEERLSQWKEAMENIQRNVEIARNIEDSFRSGSNFPPVDTAHLMRTNNQEHTAHRSNMNQKTMEKKPDHHMTSGQRTHENIAHDMKTAASEVTPMKPGQLHQATHNTQATKGKLAEISLNIESQPLGKHHVELTKGKSIELASSLRTSQPVLRMEQPHATSMSLKTDIAGSGHKIHDNKESTLRTSEHSTHVSATHKDQSSHISKIENKSTNLKQTKNAAMEWDTKPADELVKHEKSAWAETENKEATMKSAEHKKISLNDNLNVGMPKSVEQNKHFENDAEFIQKSGLTVQSNMKLSDNADLKNEKPTLGKSADLLDDNEKLRHAHHELAHAHAHAHAHAAAHALAHGHGLHHIHPTGPLGHTFDSHLIGGHTHHGGLLHHGAHLHHGGLHHGKSAEDSIHSDMTSSDNAPSFSSDINVDSPVALNNDMSQVGKPIDFVDDMHMDQLRNAHELGHAQAHAHAHASAHAHAVGHTHGSGPHHMHKAGPLGHSLDKPLEISGHRRHEGILHHGKSAEEDSLMNPSMQTNIREFAEKSALENKLFQWKHHDTARSYGAGPVYGNGLSLSAGGGGSAVGVFPNAKIGGCGIPLLLSCSPSVASGSLIKSHGYAAPAYRANEDLKLKHKRDIIKAKEEPSKLKQSTETLQKQPKPNEKKL